YGIVGVCDLRQQQSGRQAASLQLSHRVALHQRAREGPQVARPRIQAGGHRGGATGVHAAMGSLHESRRLIARDRGSFMNPAECTPVDDATYLQLRLFLFREAALLDRRDYAGWLALTADDIRYRVNAMVSRDAGVAEVDYAIVDEDRLGLKSR